MSAMPVVASPVLAVVEAAAAVTGTAVATTWRWPTFWWVLVQWWVHPRMLPQAYGTPRQCPLQCAGAIPGWYHFRSSTVPSSRYICHRRILYSPQGGFPGGYPCAPTIPAQVQQQPYSNVVKRYASWNVCYSCGFDVADGHTSMSCPPHLCKAIHQIGFNRQNAQQFIDLSHPCSTRNRHKTQLPAPM